MQVLAGTNQHLTELDVRNRSLTDQLRHEIQLGRAQEQAEREKLEARIIMNFEKALMHEKLRMVSTVFIQYEGLQLYS